MKIVPPLLLTVALVGLTGCVSVFEGTSQDISIVTNPVGAVCNVEQDGRHIATVLGTPGTITVRKSKYDLMITCARIGFQNAAYVNHSGVSAAIAANIATDLLFTGGIASIVDTVDGADNKYDSVVNISMIPNPSDPTPRTEAVNVPTGNWQHVDEWEKTHPPAAAVASTGR
ncbi:MAG TPA: hypothetical protein VHT51_15845 [Micropepsaceae bacterium]|jgi:hypothetical protein|nr:hypothetical protein [Micropepsaceae bacterium]